MADARVAARPFIKSESCRDADGKPTFELHEVQARRSVNSVGTKRGKVGELIIVGRGE